MSTSDEYPSEPVVDNPAPEKPKRISKPKKQKEESTITHKAPQAKKPKAKKAPAKKKRKVKAAKPTKKAKSKKNGKAKVKAKANGKAKKRSMRGMGPIQIKRKLYKVLLAKLPKRFSLDKDTLDFHTISEAQDMTAEGIYKWFRSDKIPPERAMVFIKASVGKLKIEDMIPFVFKA